MTGETDERRDPERQDTDQEPRQRRPYATPRLQVYGAVRDLTAGGTGTAQEPSKGQKPRV